jgi:hypothetical protein
MMQQRDSPLREQHIELNIADDRGVHAWNQQQLVFRFNPSKFEPALGYEIY